MLNVRAMAWCAAIWAGISGQAVAESFMGFDCRSDCRGHRAGFEWAKKRAIKSEHFCPQRGDRVSFYEGCLAFVRRHGPHSSEPDTRSDGEIYPYAVHARGQCSRPGTQISFHVDGAPVAEIISGNSNFSPLAAALRDPFWSFGRMRVKGKELLVLVHRSETRIMIDISDGRGMAFVSKRSELVGVNDLICEITIR